MRPGWYAQGHVDLIMDNLIAAGKAKPMIIVMDNLNAVKPGESAAIFAARGLVPPPGRRRPHRPAAPPAARTRTRRGAARRTRRRRARPATYSEMMFTDLVPMIERTYRVRAGEREPRDGGTLDGRRADVHHRARQPR